MREFMELLRVLGACFVAAFSLVTMGAAIDGMFYSKSMKDKIKKMLLVIFILALTIVAVFIITPKRYGGWLF